MSDTTKEMIEAFRAFADHLESAGKSSSKTGREALLEAVKKTAVKTEPLKNKVEEEPKDESEVKEEETADVERADNTD
jgi:hypothetical protein